MGSKIGRFHADGSIVWIDKKTGDPVAEPLSKFDEGISSSAYVIDDTMPLIKSPLSRFLYFNSKSAIRKHYAEHGVQEVGNEFERGYDPGKEKASEIEKKLDAKIKQNLIDRVIHGKR